NTIADLTATATWSSSDATVASVGNGASEGGVVAALKQGVSTVKATSGSVSGTDIVVVTNASLSSISITPSNAIVDKGSTQQSSATGTYSDRTTQDLTSSSTWSSSNPSAVTISNSAGTQGLATAIGNGASNITATFGSLSDTTKLTVSAATLSTIAISPPNP